MSEIQNNIKILTDFVDRTTDWRVGGATWQDAKTALESLPDSVEWIEKGIVEWRAQAQTNARHAEAARATARVAIGHLQRVLQDTHARIPSEQRLQWRRDAEDWLASIGADQ